MEERKESKKRFCVTRTRLVNEMVYVYAENEDTAIDVAFDLDLDAWEGFEGDIYDDLTEAVEVGA